MKVTANRTSDSGGKMRRLFLGFVMFSAFISLVVLLFILTGTSSQIQKMKWTGNRYLYHVLHSLDSNSTETESDDEPVRDDDPDTVIDVDDEVANRIKQKVRVLVWVMTSPKSYERALTVKNTWGQRTDPDLLLFFSSAAEPTLPTIALNVSEGRDHLTAKTMQAFDYIYQHYYDKADFFMKADDDTYVVMENLRYLMSFLSPDKPFVMGRHFKPVLKQGFPSGGAGYVISKAALARLGNRTKDPPMCAEDGAREDVEFSRCLGKLGVPILNSTDKFGGSRFHAYTAMQHAVTGLSKAYSYWDANVVRIGPEWINPYPISFHYIKPNDMKLMHFFFYRVRPHGINYKYH